VFVVPCYTACTVLYLFGLADSSCVPGSCCGIHLRVYCALAGRWCCYNMCECIVRYYLRFCGSCGLVGSVVGSCAYPPPFVSVFVALFVLFHYLRTVAVLFLHIGSHTMYCTSSVTLYSCCTPCVGVLTVLSAEASVCFCAEKCVLSCVLVFLFVLVVRLLVVCWVGWGVYCGLWLFVVGQKSGWGLRSVGR
jgi:hypothetical protein